jgi:AraC family transcriptional regulator of adaptative response/methylated-DNA-[protein]-cysteine methyltransferase
MSDVERIREVCRYVEGHSDETLTVESLAGLARMSKFHFARRFKAVVGVTAKEFVAATRLRRLKGGLRKERSIDAAVYGAGYGSPSRVYESAPRNLGMTPAQYRAGGKGVSISYATLETPVGLMLIAATDRGVCFAQFGQSTQELLDRLRTEYRSASIAAMQRPDHPQFAGWVDAIARHLRSEEPNIDLPLDVRATAFQMRVWKYLQSIPYGDVQSYGEVAAAIGHPKAVRAVGNAIARNTVAIVIPCHRVIRESGALGGYRWGPERKRAVLDIERAGRSRAEESR